MEFTSGAKDAGLTEYEASGSDEETPRHVNSNGISGQKFSRIRNTGQSRSHYGNVYNNYYQNAGKPDRDTRNQSDNEDVAQHHDVDEEQRNLIRDKIQDLKKALAFVGMGDRLMAISPACIDTCAWFLHTSEYAIWRDPNIRQSHNGVLWIKGNAGSGKSTLMRYIYECAQELQDNTVNIAFFYNGRSPDSLVKSVEGMYRSVLHQLYERIPRLGEMAAQRVSTTTLCPWSLMILGDLLRQAVLSLAPEEKVVFYIDALDECELDQIRSAIRFFEQLSEEATLAKIHFRLCLASRHYPQITMRSYEEAKIDAMPMHLKDIATYVTSRLILPPAIKREMQAEIQERCSGIFLWVVLVVDLLRESSDRGATRSQLYETLTSLPRELDALFAKISESAEAGYAVAMRWVLFAERALTPLELYLVIRASSDQLEPDSWNIDIESMQRYILHISRGLIQCQSTYRGYGAVEFIHDSVREYLLFHGQPSVDPVVQQMREAENHAGIAEDCQSYLRGHSMGPKNARMGNRLPTYILCYVFMHIEIAHTSKAVDFEPSGFPAHEFLAIHNAKITSYGDRFVPGHSAALLSLLIEIGHYALAEAFLQKSARSDSSTTNHVEQDPASSTTTIAPNSLDLSTLCGGRFGSPLHAAVHAGKQDLVRLLLERGACIDCCGEVILRGISQEYNSPLLLAMENRTPAMVQLLLDRGACIKSLSPKNGLNALHLACKNNDIAMVTQLLSRGADVMLPCRLEPDWKSFQGSTALHLAAHSTSPEILSLLLAAGADVNATDANGMTPLHIAMSETRMRLRDQELLKILLVAGANVDATDALGWTALMMAAANGCSIDVQILLEHKANLEYRSDKSMTAIELADSQSHDTIVKMLLLEGRLRALKGLNHAIPPSARPKIARRRPPSRVPAPTHQTQSLRTERPLQYRRLPPYRFDT
jgi:ankyrin repeat protein